MPAVDFSLLRDTVRGLRDPREILKVGHGVYKVTLEDGLTVAIKQVAGGPSPDPLEAEAAALDRLYGLGCPVPALHLVDPDLRVLVTAWAGDRTMDDLCQETGSDGAEKAGAQIAEGLSRIEEGLLGDAGCALTETADPRDQMVAILRYILSAIEGESDLGSMSEMSRSLESIGNRVCRADRSVASLDYNARNVVFDGDGTARFVDFSSLGWDWPERRFVQYVTGLGAYREGGRLVSPLTPRLASRYAETRRRLNPYTEEKVVVCALDAHDLLFHLAVLARLVRLRRTPLSPGSRLLRKAWGDPEERWKSARGYLGRPLSNDPEVTALREMLSKTA